VKEMALFFTRQPNKRKQERREQERKRTPIKRMKKVPAIAKSKNLNQLQCDQNNQKYHK